MKTRSTVELLHILLERPHYFDTGLCPLSFNLYCHGLLSSEEDIIVYNYIRKHKPFRAIFSTWWGDGFYWTPGDWTPREKWLKKHIKRLSK